MGRKNKVKKEIIEKVSEVKKIDEADLPVIVHFSDWGEWRKSNPGAVIEIHWDRSPIEIEYKLEKNDNASIDANSHLGYNRTNGEGYAD